MNEQKRNRIAAAVTVNVILLIAVLAAVVVYQLVYLSVISNRRGKLQAEIKEYERLIEEGQNDLDYLQSEQYLLILALQSGYIFPQD